ncbi:MAG: two-component system sensor histidine kinase NtrB [Thermodesulfobacteriota bacterium]
MKLRALIFVILLALGTLPIFTLVGVNLTDHIKKHEGAEAQRIAASVESGFVTLNARVETLRKSLLQAASTPMVLGMGTEGGALTGADLERLVDLLDHLLGPERLVAEVWVAGRESGLALHLHRDRDDLLRRDAREGASRPPESFLAETAELRPTVINARFEQARAGEATLLLATPVANRQGGIMGVIGMAIRPDLFLADQPNACWALGSGRVVRPPVARPGAHLAGEPLAAGIDLFSLFPGLREQMAAGRPLVWRDETGPRFTWMPLVVTQSLPPVLWIGSPVDRGAVEEWKLSLIHNIVWIVLIMMLIIAAIANAIAGKVDQIKDSILTGLDRILNRGEEEVRFAWSGPSEVVTLGEELTTLARHYATTRKRQAEAEADLRQSEDKFRNLTASAQDAIAMMDHRGNISYWNEAATDLFGYSAEEAMGKPIHVLISPRLSESGQKESAAAKPVSDGPIRETIELVTRRRDGSEVPIELSLSEARVKDQWHSIWIIRDITERKRSEEETRLQQQQLIQADKMISLGVLISGVAHEINNPNSIAMLNTAMLHRAWGSAKPILDEYHQENGDFLMAGIEYSEMREQIPRLFQELEESSRRIRNIVQDLKDYARQDTTRHMEAVDVNAVVLAAIRLNHNKIKQATNHFATELAPELPPIRGNRQRLEQVLINLIQNSCEALTAPEQAITVSSRYEPERREVVITVHDQGGGIPAGIINQIMDPFFTTKRSYGGTGLGLSVSAGIVKEHHGMLRFASSPEEGTTATVSFPEFVGEAAEVAGPAADGNG